MRWRREVGSGRARLVGRRRPRPPSTAAATRSAAPSRSVVDAASRSASTSAPLSQTIGDQRLDLAIAGAGVGRLPGASRAAPGQLERRLGDTSPCLGLGQLRLGHGQTRLGVASRSSASVTRLCHRRRSSSAWRSRRRAPPAPRPAGRPCAQPRRRPPARPCGRARASSRPAAASSPVARREAASAASTACWRPARCRSSVAAARRPARRRPARRPRRPIRRAGEPEPAQPTSSAPRRRRSDAQAELVVVVDGPAHRSEGGGRQLRKRRKGRSAGRPRHGRAHAGTGHGHREGHLDGRRSVSSGWTVRSLEPAPGVSTSSTWCADRDTSEQFTTNVLIIHRIPGLASLAQCRTSPSAAASTSTAHRAGPHQRHATASTVSSSTPRPRPRARHPR